MMMHTDDSKFERQPCSVSSDGQKIDGLGQPAQREREREDSAWCSQARNSIV